MIIGYEGGFKNNRSNHNHSHVASMCEGKYGKHFGMEDLEMKPGEGDNDVSVHHHESDVESSNSPTSVNCSMLCGSNSGTMFTGSSSGCSSSCCDNISDEEEEEEEQEQEQEQGNDDDCIDDWETVADALAADDEKRQNLSLESPQEHETNVQMDSRGEMAKGLSSGRQNLQPESGRLVKQASANARAWRADDALRPTSLPNLSKQFSLPNPDRRRCGGGVAWAHPTAAPRSCPICCEDLDLTDSSFLPCPCGFRLCLFCHKRIIEEDARCPGCRKSYESETSSFSMIQT